MNYCLCIFFTIFKSKIIREVSTPLSPPSVCDTDFVHSFVDVLLPYINNINVSDRAGRTSLHHAAYNGHIEVSPLLNIEN